MKDKVLEGGTIGMSVRTVLALAVFFLFASWANANVIDVWPGPGTPITDNMSNVTIGDTILVHPGTYTEDVILNQSIILRGLSNPVLTNTSVGGESISVTGDGSFAAVTGFTISGSSTAINVSSDATNVSLVYNNIYDNGLGLNASGFDDQNCYSYPPYTLNFWGDYGDGPHRGEPYAVLAGNSKSDIKSVDTRSAKIKAINKAKINAKSKISTRTKINAKSNNKDKVKTTGHNNGVKGRADYLSWLTGRVINGSVNSSDYPGDCLSNRLVLLNPDAGVNITINGEEPFESCVVGSAEYLETPYGPIPSTLGNAVRFVDVFVIHDRLDEARVGIGYNDTQVENAGVCEDTLMPYLWVGTRWIAATDVIRDPYDKVVSGNFTTTSLTGEPIALIGKNYNVTILPPASSKPISIKPVLNITISSMDNIGNVSYQIDGHAINGWKLIDNYRFISNFWQNTSWTISDADWANLTNGTHTFYFNFTRETLPSVGGNGEIIWTFDKEGNVPPPSPIVVTSPKAGDVLTRAPWLITWTMPSPENVASVDLWFARDGNFLMRGGLNNPIHIATLGADTSYSWTSPNFRTDIARIAVVVKYIDNSQFVGYSDNFSLASGYSFQSHKPTPHLPWDDVGSGISKAVTVLGSWFHKPHIPYVIG